MKLKYLIAIIIIYIFTMLTASSATRLFPGGGGTGTSTPPSYGQLLVGTSGGVYQLQATSTLGITATETYTGTVTSVAMTVPTGLTISGSPITEDGTLAITLTAGYDFWTDAKWDVRFAATNTDALDEGSVNKYLTQSGWDVFMTATTTLPKITTLAALTITSGQVSDMANYWDNRFNGTTTDGLTEGSINLYNQTHTGDVTGATSLTIAATAVHDSMIDFGTGAGQVNTADVTELTNLYWTTNRADVWITGTTTLPKITTLAALSITKAQVSDFGTYESVLTFNYPLTRAANAVSLDFGTTTSNTWADTQTFGAVSFPDNAIAEADVNFVTSCGTGNHLIISGGNLDCEANSGGGTVGTSTTPTKSSLAYWGTSGSFPELLESVATTTLTASSPLALSNPVVKVGGSNSVLSLDTSGTWSGNAGTASALASNPAPCGASNFVTDMDANGTLTCAVPAGGSVIDQLGQIGDVSTTTLAWGSVIRYNSTTAKWESVATSTLGLPTLTGTETLTNKTFTDVTFDGAMDLTDAVVTIHTYPAFRYGTSTAWSATTTMALGPAYNAQTWYGFKCFTNTGSLNVEFGDGTNFMNLFNASTTVGTVAPGSNNAFTAGEKRYVRIGTPASSPTEISCSVDYLVNN